MKVNKILNKISISSNVEAQGAGCKEDCDVKVWAGKTASEGNAGGCWSTIQPTPRWNPWH
ncbi:hypothetical protein [Paenibacillus graminis]|uniref:hypothetical protein n=1 Tax=Paenibacillus graminis TaxID=189425 RepID=UPI0009DCFBC3|nr:hypothetical protein [Paenibacillus graminis]